MVKIFFILFEPFCNVLIFIAEKNCVLVSSEEDKIENAHKEIMVMSQYKCDQLVKYLGSYVVDRELWIVMEYLEAGSLAEIMKSTGPFDEFSISYIARELLLVSFS